MISLSPAEAKLIERCLVLTRRVNIKFGPPYNLLKEMARKNLARAEFESLLDADDDISEALAIIRSVQGD